MLLGALVAAVIALVATVAVTVGGLGGPSSGPSVSRGFGQDPWAVMRGGSMMGSMGTQWLTGDEAAVSSISAARARAATAAEPAGLHPGEVIWFDNGFYVELKDGAGKPATEVIVDPRTGAVSTEPGPAMIVEHPLRDDARRWRWRRTSGLHEGTRYRHRVAGSQHGRHHHRQHRCLPGLLHD